MIEQADRRHRQDRAVVMEWRPAHASLNRYWMLMGVVTLAGFLCGGIGGYLSGIRDTSTTGSCMSVDLPQGAKGALGAFGGAILGTWGGCLLASALIGGDFTVRAAGRRLEARRASSSEDSAAETLLRADAPDDTQNLLRSGYVPYEETLTLLRAASEEGKE